MSSLHSWLSSHYLYIYIYKFLLERSVPDGVYLRHVDAGLVQVLHLPGHLLVRWYNRFLQQTLDNMTNLCINLSFVGGLKMCFFDGVGGVILSTFFTYKNNRKSNFKFFVFAW